MRKIMKFKNIKKKKALMVVLLLTYLLININIPVIYGSTLPKSTINDTFPASYKSYIDRIKAAHPNWEIKAYHTHLDWNTVVNSQSSGTYSRIANSKDREGKSIYSDAWKRIEASNLSSYNAAGFVLASKDAVKYTLDPRNFLNDQGIFQFRAIDKNVNSDTVNSVNEIAFGTPMANTDYKNIIKSVGDKITISPNFIISRIRQETSCDTINNNSINGKNSIYPGYYNFFNIGATDGDGAVQRGINLAFYRGWNTQEKAIEGGMNWLKDNYIKYGQNTVYFQKFDVANPYGNAVALLKYQYMSNITAPVSEANFTYNGLVRAGTLENKYTFYIPIYDNMPTEASPIPTTGYYENDNTKVYVDDPNTNDSMDTFNIRSIADSSNDTNIVYKLTQSSIVNEKIILTRTKKGIDTGWDYVEFTIDGKKVEGYVWNSYVFEYLYTKVTGVNLDNTIKTIKVGDTAKLNVTVTPANAQYKNVIWKTSNGKVATVDTNGNITAVATGTVVITAITEDQNKAVECMITVTEKSPSITLDREKYTIIKNNNAAINVTISDTDIKEYDVNIENENIAKIVDGKIKGISLGETTITITLKGTEIKKTLNISVIELQEGDIILDDTIKETNKILTKISPEMKSQELSSKIQTTYNVVITNSNGINLKDADIVGTGSKVRVQDINNNIIQEYIVVIYGDVSGDGKINSGDLLAMVKHLNKNKVITKSEFLKSADVNQDGNINSGDLLRVVKYLNGNGILGN
ncbi:MAG: Ig-like domain-containing protein [Clostridia bacterium]|nr:Ig-like domain-containing protein [Clostridia bacterium]